MRPTCLAGTPGNTDATSMPRYYQPWSNGLPDLRSKLKPVDQWRYFSMAQRNVLKKRLAEQGFGADYAGHHAHDGARRSATGGV